MEAWSLVGVVLRIHDGFVLQGAFQQAGILQRSYVENGATQHSRDRLDDASSSLWFAGLQHLGSKWLVELGSMEGTEAGEGDSGLEGAWEANRDHLVKSEHLDSFGGTEPVVGDVVVGWSS